MSQKYLDHKRITSIVGENMLITKLSTFSIRNGIAFRITAYIFCYTYINDSNNVEKIRIKNF